MNSYWIENLIIFVMTLVLTHFDNQIKIRVSRACWESTSSQTWSKLPKISEELKFDIKI